MSELPDLPPAPRHHRPLPPGGLENAMRDGRRRQVRFLGAAGAVVTAVAAVAAFALASPSSVDDSLQYAGDPTPSAALAAESAAPSSSPQADPSPVSSGAASPAPSPSRAGSRSPAAGPVALLPRNTGGTPAATPQPKPGEDYVETPREHDAPATCRQAPGASAGPIIFGGGGTSCTEGSASNTTVKRGGRVTATTDLCNAHGAKPVTIGWDTGQEHEVVAATSGGKEVYRLSASVRYPQGAHERALGDGRCLVWTGVWETRTTDGQLVPAGSYRVRVSVFLDTVNGKRTQETGGAIEFTVNVQE